MKKKLLLAATIAVSSFAFGQVGINTAAPNATLDITGVPSDASKTDGFIAPRLTGDQLKAKDNVYGTAQTGAVVYVTQLPTSGSSSKTANVSAIGYYYFDGLIWQTLNNDVWNYVSGTTATNTAAGVSTDNIWRSGNVTIGAGGSFTPTTKFTVNQSITSAPAGGSIAISNIMSSNAQGQKIGISSDITDNSTTGISTNFGISAAVQDKSTAQSSGYGGFFPYNMIGSKTNPSSSNTYGVNTGVNLFSTGTLGAGNIYGVTSTAGGVNGGGNVGDISVNNLRAFDGSARPYTVSGHTFTSPMAIGGQMEVSLVGGGTSTVTSAYGVNASFNASMAGGSVTAGAAASLRSYTGFGSTGNYNITRLYGLFVDAADTSTGTKVINNSYGLFISRYRFTGDTASNAYNLYSQGADTKNYFQGRIGAGTNVPAAQLHVVKQASDLTPAIIEGCPDLADNAAALAAGLPVGALYKTGDVLKVVH